MKVVVDTTQDITQLFKMISENFRNNNINADCLLENFIIISSDGNRAKKIVAETISEYIILTFERKFLLDFIKPFELLKNEAEEIADCIASDNELKNNRFKILTKEVMAHMTSGHINIDGLTTFRLEKYKQELQFAAEYFIDELSAKKSYDEFIGLMKYFTEIQSPVIDTVILTETLGEYKLTDTDGNPLLLKFDEEFADDLAPLGLSREDILISNLMAAMPKKIVFDNINTDKPIINTISRIFEGRITH